METQKTLAEARLSRIQARIQQIHSSWIGLDSTMIPDSIQNELSELRKEEQDLRDEIKSVDLCYPFKDVVGNSFYHWFAENVASWMNSETTFKEIPKSWPTGNRYREAVPPILQFYIEDVSPIVPKYEYGIIDFDFQWYRVADREYAVAVSEKHNAVRLLR